MADRCGGDFTEEKIYRGRATISAQRALAAECAADPASEPALASAFVFIVAVDAQCDAARHDAGRLLALGAIVRGGGLRRRDHLGFMARLGRVSRAGERNLAGDFRA